MFIDIHGRVYRKAGPRQGTQPFWAEIAPLDTVASRSGYPKTPVKQEGALPRNPAYAVQFLTEFQDRLLFNMDICTPPPATAPCPLIDVQLELRKLKKISETVFQKVARENAVRGLGLNQ